MGRAEVEYEIIQTIGVIGKETEKGWQKEVNLISWNGAEPKVDIRAWRADHQKMSKGITLTKQEAIEVAGILKEIL